MKSIVTATAILTVLSGCAPERPTPSLPPLKIVSQASTKPQPSAQVPTGEQLLGQEPAEIQQAVKRHEDGGSWPIYKSAVHVLYPYGQEPQPIVDSAPLRTTDIQLQPGETITDVAMGDTERWWQLLRHRATLGTRFLTLRLNHSRPESKPISLSTRRNTSTTCCSDRADAPSKRFSFTIRMSCSPR